MSMAPKDLSHRAEFPYPLKVPVEARLCTKKQGLMGNSGILTEIVCRWQERTYQAGGGAERKIGAITYERVRFFTLPAPSPGIKWFNFR